MKRIVLRSASCLILGTLSVGCGVDKANLSNVVSMAANVTPAKAAFKVGLVTDAGGPNDYGFNHLSYLGLRKAEKSLGLTGSVVQANTPSEYTSKLREFAYLGYTLVIADSYLMKDAVEEVSREYPGIKFVIVDAPITDRPNVTSAIFKTEQSAFVAGAFVGLMETTKGIAKLNTRNVVGVVCGVPVPPVQEYLAGFQQGFKTTDPSGTILLKWTNSFSDRTLGNAMAKSEISSGADIVYQLAGGAGEGVIEAAQQARVYALGVGTDQAYLAPDNVLTSTVKRVDNATYDIIQSAMNGQFQSGVHYFDLQNQGVGLSSIKTVVPSNIVHQVNFIESQIISGRLHVPSNTD